MSSLTIVSSRVRRRRETTLRRDALHVRKPPRAHRREQTTRPGRVRARVATSRMQRSTCMRLEKIVRHIQTMSTLAHAARDQARHRARSDRRRWERKKIGRSTRRDCTTHCRRDFSDAEIPKKLYSRNTYILNKVFLINILNE